MNARQWLVTTVVAALLGFCAPTFAADAGKALSPKLTIESEDGKNALTLGLAVQAMFQYYEKDQGEDFHPLYSSQFRWRRIRPTMRGSILGGDLDFYFHLSTAPGAIELMDFYANYNLSPMIRFRFGQSKIPFTRYRIQSFKNLQFVDWSPVSKYFGAERQVGFTLHNGYEKPMPFEYELGVYNGLNSRKAHNVGLPNVTGELTGNPSAFVDPTPYDEFHPATVFHIAYNYGGIVTAYETDFEKIGPRFAVGASTVWDANPVPYRDYGLRAAPEFLLKAYGFAVGGAYYLGWYEKDGELKDLTMGLNGVVAQASFLIGQWVEIGTRYTFVGSTEDLRKDSRRNADVVIGDVEKQLAAAPEDQAGALQEQLDALGAQYDKAGQFYATREWTIGANVYIVGRTLKWQNDVTWISNEAFDGEELRDLRYRTQLQFAF